MPLTWAKFGRIATGSQGGISGVSELVFGYVAWGAYGTGTDDNAEPFFTTWFSADGRTWERTIHAESVVPCPGWTARPNLETYAPASDGRTLVFTASYLLPDADPCGRTSMISLSTIDGRTWSRSQPFAEGWAEHAWAIPGGWETLVSTGGRLVTIWRSTDLATWTRVASQPSDTGQGHEFWVAAAGPDGTRMAVSIEGTDEAARSTLQSSNDSVNWAPVRSIPAGFDVTSVTPPGELGSPWLVTIESWDPEEARVLISTDLVTWKSVKFKKPGIRELTPAGTGWIAVGFWPPRETGCLDSCRPERPSLYASPDGRSWVKRPGSLPPGDARIIGTDGSGGVLAAGEPSKAGNVTIWRLEAGS